MDGDRAAKVRASDSIFMGSKMLSLGGGSGGGEGGAPGGNDGDGEVMVAWANDLHEAVGMGSTN